MKLKIGRHNFDLGTIARGAALVTAGIQVVNDVAPDVIEVIEQRRFDLDQVVGLTSIGLHGRKVGKASVKTVDLFIQAMASLASDLRKDGTLAIREDRP